MGKVRVEEGFAGKEGGVTHPWAGKSFQASGKQETQGRDIRETEEILEDFLQPTLQKP